MVALGNQYQITIADLHGFIYFAVFRKHSLKGKTLRWIQTVIVNFFQIGDIRISIFIMPIL